MGAATPEPKPATGRGRRRRPREQQLAIGPVKRVRFRRARRQMWQALGVLRALLGRIDAALGRVRTPQPDTDPEATPTKSVRTTVLSATLCLGVAALLVSGKIVEIADRLPLGPDRDRWLEAADHTDRVANGLSLNRPYDLLRDLRGADTDAGQQIDVIGDVEDLLQLPGGEAEDLPQPAGGEASDPAPDAPETQVTDTTPAAADDSTPTTSTTSTAPTTSTTTVPPEPAYLRLVPVSEEWPLKTFVAGDSQAFHLGRGLRTHPLSEVLEITLDQRHSTGLARPGYFNWPVHFIAIAVHYDPEVVIMTLGSNDWRSMTSPEDRILSRGSVEWRAEWARRLGVTFDVLEAPHRQVIWVGLPPTRADDFREGYAVINEIAAEVSAERGFVTMIDIWDMFGGDEPYRESVPPPDDPDGRPVDVRQRDGVHLNQTGSGWVIDLIAAEIDRIAAEISPAAEPDPDPSESTG